MHSLRGGGNGGREAERGAPDPVGVAVVPCEGECAPHETGSLRFAAVRVAAMLGIEVHEVASGEQYFWIPADTLSRQAATALGILHGSRLWGGIVPFDFVATKLVSHPLWKARNAPAGWTAVPGIEACTLPGYSVFTLEDAEETGRVLLRDGEIRIKHPHARGGHGQTRVGSERELDRWLQSTRPDSVRQGLVLERNLVRSTTYSVGSADLPGRRIAYHGRQHCVRDPEGAVAYGGSSLAVFKGDMVAMRAALAEGTVAEAVDVAMRFDRSVREAYGVLATRCNYDVIAGVDSKGRRHFGVLEQSWRVGGASMAEVLAMERFDALPDLGWLLAETVESYSHANPPPNAVTFWPGGDGTPLKYARIVRHGH